MKKILILLALTSYSSKAFPFERKVDLNTEDQAVVQTEHKPSQSNNDIQSTEPEKTPTISKDSNKKDTVSSEKSEEKNKLLRGKDIDAIGSKKQSSYDGGLNSEVLYPYGSESKRWNTQKKYSSNHNSESQDFNSPLVIGGGLLLTAAIAGGLYYYYGLGSTYRSSDHNFEQNIGKIIGGHLLPKISVTDPNYSTSYIKDTVSLDAYVEGDSDRSRSYRNALLEDGVHSVTKVRGDGNCGFYSIYLANKLLESTPIDDFAIGAEVIRMKNLVKERAMWDLNIAEGDELDHLKLKMGRAVAQELLEQGRGYCAFDPNSNPVADIEEFFKTNPEAYSGQRSQMLRGAELEQEKSKRYLATGRAADDIVRSITGTGSDSVLDTNTFALNYLQKRSDLGHLYGTWIIDNSGAKLDDIGIKILAKELGRTIIVRDIDRQEDFPLFFDSGNSAGHDPIYLVNKGGHWDLAHLTRNSIETLLENRVLVQEKNLRSLNDDAQGRQQKLLVRYIKDYTLWKERNEGVN